MIDIDQVLEWKQSYEAIYQTTILDQRFIYRTIGREEYKQIILMDLGLGEFQEAICHTAILYPQEFDFSKGIAGIAEIISDNILDVSGLQLNQAGELLSDFREEMYNFDYQADVIIHEAFQEFSLEQIATWSIRKTMYYLSRAEWILTNLKGVPLQYLEDATMQQYLEEQEAQQQPQQQPQGYVPQSEMPPEFAEQFAKMPQPEMAAGEQMASDFMGTAPKKPAPETGIQSEEEILAMLSGTGKPVAKPSTDMSNRPELRWFEYMDELKGEFD